MENLGDSENYMRILYLDFSIFGVAEIWLYDINYGLYGLDGYELFESTELIRWEEALVCLWGMV